MGTDGIVLLHGLGAGPDSWAGVTAHLPATVTTLMPRICSTDGSMEFDLDRAIEVTSDALDNLGTPRRTLLGHSLGAVVALATVASGVTVDHLVLISGFVRAPRMLLNAQAAIFGLLPQRLLGPDVDREPLIVTMKALRNVDLRRGAASLAVHTTVVCGERDWLNRRQAQLAARLIPNADLLLIPRVGHMVPEQRPDQVAAALLS